MTETARTQEPSLAEAAQALSRIAEELSRVSSRLATCALEGESPLGAAKELSRVSSRLATCAEKDSDEATLLGESYKALTSLSQRLGEWEARGASTPAGERAARLRRRILQDLLHRGPALPIELAAATLSLPEEIQPVLQDLAREDLIQIREVKGGRLVTLTARGRQEAGR